MATKAADMLIARRADTRARADFATWKMIAKLNGFTALPAEAQNFLEGYRQLLAKMNEADLRAIYAYIHYLGGEWTPMPANLPPGQTPKGPYEDMSVVVPAP